MSRIGLGVITVRDDMSKEDLIEFLRENLSLEIEEESYTRYDG